MNCSLLYSHISRGWSFFLLKWFAVRQRYELQQGRWPHRQCSHKQCCYEDDSSGFFQRKAQDKLSSFAYISSMSLPIRQRRAAAVQGVEQSWFSKFVGTVPSFNFCPSDLRQRSRIFSCIPTSNFFNLCSMWSTTESLRSSSCSSELLDVILDAWSWIPESVGRPTAHVKKMPCLME